MVGSRASVGLPDGQCSEVVVAGAGAATGKPRASPETGAGQVTGNMFIELTAEHTLDRVPSPSVRTRPRAAHRHQPMLPRGPEHLPLSDTFLEPDSSGTEGVWPILVTC